ncbi:MAG: sulfotransferase domain-containing protein, partial [Chitinophagales bacterium]
MIVQTYMSELKIPNLIIGGVHKAGTTSVFTYLAMHPDVCGSSTKEIGFFMPLKYGQEIGSMEEYSKYWSHCEGKKKYYLEASPSYIYGKEIIAQRIQKELGSEVKMIFIFRNPAERLFSFYERKKVNTYLSENISFRQFVDYSVAMAEKELDYHGDDEEALFIRGIKEGCYIEYLPPWLDLFGRNLKIMFFEDLKKDSAAFMNELCHWLNLDFSIYSREDFKVENQTIAFKNQWLHKAMLGVNKKFESFWRKNVGLKRTLRSLYKKVNAAEGNREKLSDEDRHYLNELYAPYNMRLAEFLRGKGIT